MRLFLSYLLIASLLAPTLGWGRDLKQRDAFRRTHPCPATGKVRGACPGYVVDHILPLCAGGEDRPSNMQWQTIADGKAKDRIEVLECRAARRRASG